MEGDWIRAVYLSFIFFLVLLLSWRGIGKRGEEWRFCWRWPPLWLYHSNDNMTFHKHIPVLLRKCSTYFITCLDLFQRQILVCYCYTAMEDWQKESRKRWISRSNIFTDHNTTREIFRSHRSVSTQQTAVFFPSKKSSFLLHPACLTTLYLHLLRLQKYIINCRYFPESPVSSCIQDI